MVEPKANTVHKRYWLKPSQPATTFVEILAAAALLLISLKLIAAIALAVLVLVHLAWPLHRKRAWLHGAAAAYAAALLIPIDVQLFGCFNQSHSARNGPRLVHCCSTCMPNRGLLHEKFGEFAEHPGFDLPLGPRWLLVGLNWGTRIRT